MTLKPASPLSVSGEEARKKGLCRAESSEYGPYIEVLRSSPLFAGMSQEEILSALRCIDAKKAGFRKDEYILRAGESTASVGLLLSGSALIIQEDLWGYRNVLSKIRPGECFGESFAASPGTPLTVSITAGTDCTVLRLEMGRLLHVCPSACSHHNRLVRNLVTVLSGRLLSFNDKITHMSKRRTRDKLLSYLSGEALRHDSLSFDIPYNRQELADYLCVERSAMSAELSRLQKEGILKTRQNHFDLSPDPLRDPL